MPKSRREFLSQSALGLAASALVSPEALSQAPTPSTPGAPPAFGTAPAAGPEVSVATFTEAEKLVQIEMTQPDLAQAAGNWRVAMAPLYERRVGPRKITMQNLPELIVPFKRPVYERVVKEFARLAGG